MQNILRFSSVAAVLVLSTFAALSAACGGSTPPAESVTSSNTTTTTTTSTSGSAAAGGIGDPPAPAPVASGTTPALPAAPANDASSSAEAKGCGRSLAPVASAPKEGEECGGATHIACATGLTCVATFRCLDSVGSCKKK